MFKYHESVFPPKQRFLSERSVTLQTPYEIASKSVIPAIRGMISRRLLEKDFTQAQIARALGITQPAVSKYFWDKRGRAIDFDNREDVTNMTEVIADGIANQRLSKVQVANMIKEICDYVMRMGYMCDLHYEVDPEVKNANCKICMEPSYQSSF